MRRAFFSERVREKAYTVAGVEVGKLAVDVGAGTGFLTEGLLHQGLRVIAVDPSEAMLAAMRKKLADRDALDCRVGTAERLPVTHGVADYVFGNMVLHHVDEPSAAIREMVRALKPGGKLVLTDMDEHPFEFLRTEQHDRWLGFRRDDIRQWFLDAGLIQVLVDCVGENCSAASEGTGETASVSLFVAVGTKPRL
jgi:ubiquinone/menaquinone biosynthesis C-methylase UbiE